MGQASSEKWYEAQETKAWKQVGAEEARTTGQEDICGHPGHQAQPPGEGVLPSSASPHIAQSRPKGMCATGWAWSPTQVLQPPARG